MHHQVRPGTLGVVEDAAKIVEEALTSVSPAYPGLDGIVESQMCVCEKQDSQRTLVVDAVRHRHDGSRGSSPLPAVPSPTSPTGRSLPLLSTAGLAQVAAAPLPPQDPQAGVAKNQIELPAKRHRHGHIGEISP